MSLVGLKEKMKIFIFILTQFPAGYDSFKECRSKYNHHDPIICSIAGLVNVEQDLSYRNSNGFLFKDFL